MSDYEVIRDTYLKQADDKAPIRKLIDAADAEIAGLTGRLRLASRLLESVRIQGGCGSWTDEARDAWASDLKDFFIGAIKVERDHEIKELERKALYWLDQAAAEMERANGYRMAVLHIKEQVDALPTLSRVVLIRETITKALGER